MPQAKVVRINRNYGRHDGRRYENITTADASLANKSFRTVTVDCRFQFQKSKWGVLTNANREVHPGGIVYLDLTFQSLGGHRLKYAIVTVTLDDDSDDLMWHTPVTRSPSLDKIPIHIGHYGPDMGRQSRKEFDEEHRWSFSSLKRPGKRNRSHFKVLKWAITENKLDSQSYHNNTFHTAFSFQHGYHPFFIQVAIEGRLKSKWDNFRSKFSSWNDEKFATTLVNFVDGKGPTKPLDQLAQGLAYAMERKNVLKAPPEAKNPKASTSHETLPTSPVQEHHTSQEREGTLPGSDNSETREKVDQYDSTEDRSIQDPEPEPRIFSEPNTTNEHNIQESSKPLGSEELEKNLEDRPQPSKALSDNEESRYIPTRDWFNTIKALELRWKLLLQHTLQICGLIAITVLLANQLTRNGTAL
ncbi:hypothetical protein GGS24DRAFT_507140 [Hypoxylon argillaceum]|nr:hypothetical protein GGS24DRAFT_507140 [Hypoxylon argillaceum]